mgnify:CR=1 FL=1|jgi:hypothetical protein
MNTQNIMAIYYYKFQKTEATWTFTNSSQVSEDGWDISEFDGDPRGTARVADWSDLSSFDENDYDALKEVFGITENTGLGWTSFDGDTQRTSGNKYYKASFNNNRAYYSVISVGTDYSGGYQQTNSISSNPIKNLKIGSWRFANYPALVYFPNYKANGGHSTLIINGSISVNWSDANNRFQSSDGNTTLSHNGTTWVGDAEGTSSTSTLNGSNVKYYVDPVSSDIDWTNSLSVSLPSSSAQGDPHINPLFGDKYTI